MTPFAKLLIAASILQHAPFAWADCEEKQKPKTPEWNNFGFGTGLGIQLGQNAVEEASVDENNIVRVDKEADGTAGLIFEGHYLFEVVKMPGKLEHSTHWGLGPFVAVQAGSDDSIIDSVGLGLMIALKRRQKIHRV